MIQLYKLYQITFIMLYIYTELSHLSFSIQPANKAWDPNNHPSVACAFAMTASQPQVSIR